MKKFNLFDWVFEYCLFVWYFMIVLIIVGVFFFINFGCEEDFFFIIKMMVI